MPVAPVTRAVRKVFRKRSHPPGTAPGTLIRVSPHAETTLTLTVYDDAGASVRDVATVAAAKDLFREGKRHWLHIVGHQPEVVAELGTCLGVHPLVLEDILGVGQRPKLESHPGHLFLVAQVLRDVGAGAFDEEQVSLLLFRDLVVTIEERAPRLFLPIERRIEEGHGRIRAAGADYLAYAVIDTVVDYLFPLLDELGERLEQIEAELLDAPDRRALERLHAVKRELLRVRRVAWPMREALGSLLRDESDLVSAGCRVFLRDVYDHAVQVLDMVETFREMSASLADLYLSAASNRMNEVMKVLTIIATIFIPLTFIAGIYGMNFDPAAGPLNMPELRWRFGYPFALGLMAALAALLLAVFRRKKWL